MERRGGEKHVPVGNSEDQTYKFVFWADTWVIVKPSLFSPSSTSLFVHGLGIGGRACDPYWGIPVDPKSSCYLQAWAAPFFYMEPQGMSLYFNPALPGAPILHCGRLTG